MKNIMYALVTLCGWLVGCSAAEDYASPETGTSFLAECSTVRYYDSGITERRAEVEGIHPGAAGLVGSYAPQLPWADQSGLVDLRTETVYPYGPDHPVTSVVCGKSEPRKAETYSGFTVVVFRKYSLVSPE